MNRVEVTILIPCLNEEESIQDVILNAQEFIKKYHIHGEVVVVDNGSIDDSVLLAQQAGARVVFENVRGYGSALITGSNHACGKYVIMADADGSYDFLEAYPILELLRNDYDLVIGNRFFYPMEAGAMPISHKYLGNPILSFLGRNMFHIPIKDFHCGLRGYNRERIVALQLKALGMDYASEMIIKAAMQDYRIGEVPIILHKDKRISRTSHLNTVKDGFCHLKLMWDIYRKKDKRKGF